jgi:hypothetical protein
VTALFHKVRQFCTVVDDFDATVRHLVDDLGLGPFKCWNFGPPQLFETTFRGRPARWTMKLGLTWLDDVQWEVIQPVDGASLYREHLDAHGPGVQHILLSTGRVPFAEARRRLTERHHPFAQTARANTPMRLGSRTVPRLPNWLVAPMSLHFGYVDAEATLRTSLELTRYPPGLSERAALRSSQGDFHVPEGERDIERTLPGEHLSRVAKVTILTRDLDATVRWYLDLGGVGPWHVFERDRERVAWAMLGDVLFELLQPRGAASPWLDTLEARGEGVAALGVIPKPGRDLIARCEHRGYPILERGPSRVHLGARARIGTDLEILTGEPPAVAFARLAPERVAT